jgi:Short C-terminal domain/Phospholipase_D-nuclease N-terminal
LLGLFWTMLIFFMWIVWIMLLIRVFADIFRSHDMGGLAKALWSIFVILFPFLGVFVYMIARGRSMTQRDVAVAQQHEAAFQSYVRGVASDGVSTADELAKLSELKAKGVLTDAEYEQQKTKLLA